MFLVPLAGNVAIRKYTHGEYILKQDTEPEGLYIVRKGECISMLEKVEVKVFKTHPFNKLSAKELDAHFDHRDESRILKGEKEREEQQLEAMRQRKLFRYDILKTEF